MDKRRGIKFFRRSFLPHSAKKFIKEPLYVPRKFSWGKFSCIGGAEEASQCCHFFLSHSTKRFVWGTLVFSETFWYGKKIWIRRGFHRNFIDSQCPKSL